MELNQDRTGCLMLKVPLDVSLLLAINYFALIKHVSSVIELVIVSNQGYARYPG